MSEVIILNWFRKGVMKSEAEVHDANNSLIASYLRKNSLFSHKTKADWRQELFIFNYDGSLFDNLIIYDQDKNRIGKYEQSMGIEEGTIFDERDKRKYDYRRIDPVGAYYYEVKEGERFLAGIEIQKQDASASSGIMKLNKNWENESILPLCTGLHLVMHN